MANWWDKYAVSVPEGASGLWSVMRFTVTEEDARWANINCHGRWISPGTYTRLTREKQVIMSDTPLEISEFRSFERVACGRVLINGLGLGVVLQAVLRKPEVQHATVVDISEEVISLVRYHYYAMFPGKLHILHADALEYRPGRNEYFDAVWHDI